jgi:hypothetical protein
MWLRPASPFSLIVKISPSLINWSPISSAIHLNQPHLYFSFIEQSMGFDCYRGAEEFSFASTRTFARCQGIKRSGVVARNWLDPLKSALPRIGVR